MSGSQVLAVTPNRRPSCLLELRNSHGTAPSVWQRLGVEYWHDDGAKLDALYAKIETLPDHTQAVLVLTSDVGVVPWQAFEWAADAIDEFERVYPPNPDHVNHWPAIAELLRSKPEAPFVGIYQTSVTDNPFDPWDYESDAPGNGLSASEMWVLPQHLHFVIPRDTEETP